MEDFGPLEELLQNPDIMDIMINGPDSVYIWHRDRGRVHDTNIRFEGVDHLRQVMDAVLASFGETISVQKPVVNARLTDGSTVLAVIPPIAVNGPTMVISRTMNRTLSLERLIELNAISQAAADYLRASVIARANIIVYGGYSSGKTTLLNALANQIPDEARVIAIHDIADNSLKHHNKVVLETRPADLDGQGAITNKQLVDLALTMIPERLIVGSLSGEEVSTLLSIMNIGFNVMAGMEGADSRDVLSRLETMAVAANPATPLLTVRHQIATGLNLLVGIQLMDSGVRRTQRISQIVGLEGDTIALKDIFVYDSERGVIPTGEIPQGLDKLTGISEALFAAE